MASKENSYLRIVSVHRIIFERMTFQGVTFSDGHRIGHASGDAVFLATLRRQHYRRLVKGHLPGGLNCGNTTDKNNPYLSHDFAGRQNLIWLSRGAGSRLPGRLKLLMGRTAISLPR